MMAVCCRTTCNQRWLVKVPQTQQAPVFCSQYKAAADKLSAPIRQFAESKTGKRDLARLSHWFEAFTAPSGRRDQFKLASQPPRICEMLPVNPFIRPRPQHVLLSP